MNVCSGNIKLFSGNSHYTLARDIASELNILLGLSEISRFSDGEICVRINETVRGADVYIVQSTSPPVNEHLMELLIMIDAMRRASAGRITAVIPYYGYARQDRKARARDPISAKLVADLLTVSGADRVISMDLHCAQIQGFFNIPVDHLLGYNLFNEYYREKFSDFSDVMVVSPDLGSVSRARKLADKLYVPLAIVDKRRNKPNESEVMNIIGSVEGKRVILIDDSVDTGGSLTNAAKALEDAGATEVYACCTHAILSKPAIDRINESPVKELLILDTVPLPDEKKISKIKIKSVAKTFAHAILNIHEGLSVSKLFE